ncbi:TetR/AcrR family transcriptional regulator [Micromonospora musae]|uniref:TetR/AcrR family transcriptional regulator n=1 Tax=Micromonospora musae TaxID=1894970 RepID=A0A3A9YAS9_9ACTN|nr:TetR/AcrR family transcriptional regulator [Micromonospora musae]RKN22170.1 TetR/AcrR family transcriptional regulator [Micromonospora musae]RKN33933.1 TetR/AcrR family transcriptional regulator [Micromonospora musae]
MGDEQGSAPTKPRRISQRGIATRERILEAANRLMFVRGVNATTLDDVREASQTSKSQLYHHFADKQELVRALVRYRGALVLQRERGGLERLRSFSGLVRWRNALVQANSLNNGKYGCGLGSMAVELSDQDEQARSMLSETFAAWEKLISDGLHRMRDSGALRQEAEPEKLATGLMAALQGGYLLANTAHDVGPMEVALDMALEHIKSFLTEPSGESTR